MRLVGELWFVIPVTTAPIIASLTWLAGKVIDRRSRTVGLDKGR